MVGIFITNSFLLKLFLSLLSFLGIDTFRFNSETFRCFFRT
jgi:hypothetical protein